MAWENNVKHSYSKKVYPYDNASMESFNAILKKEEVNVNTYETFKETKLAIYRYICDIINILWPTFRFD